MSACLALGVLLSGTTASADPVRIVTSGHFSMLPQDNETGFVMLGTDFAIHGGDLRSTFPDTCGPCTPGSTLNLSATMSPSTFQPESSATVDGRTYTSVFFSGDFNFDAGSVVVPHVSPDGPHPWADSRFTFTGTLVGHADSTMAGTPLFSLLLRGSGTASHNFFADRTTGEVFADGFNYEFDQVAPVPEPGSLFLFGSGAAWMASRWRRRTTGAA